MARRRAYPWVLSATVAAVLLLAGCGSPPDDPDQTVRAHPAEDPPARLCSVIGATLIRQVVPSATSTAKSSTTDQRPDLFVNRTIAKCTLHGSGTALTVTVTRYGSARDGMGTRHVRSGLERAKGQVTSECRDAISTPASAPKERAGDQECLVNARDAAGHHFEAFYLSRRGSDVIAVGYADDRPGPHPTHLTTPQADALGRGIARTVWQAI